MYAPTQGPVNTGFAQTVIEAKATGSAIKRGQLVSIGFNADGAPSATLSTSTENFGPNPIGVASEDINQGYNGSVIIAGVADILIDSGVNSDAVTSTEAGAGVYMSVFGGSAGYATPRGTNGAGSAAVGVTTETKPTTSQYVPMAFSAFARTQAASTLTGNGSQLARHTDNTHIPQPGQANRVTISDSWEPSTSSFVTTYKESFYLAADSSAATGDILIIDHSSRNGVRSIYAYGGYTIQGTSGVLNSLPHDVSSVASGFQVSADGSLTFRRALSTDDADDGYFVWITYSERAS